MHYATNTPKKTCSDALNGEWSTLCEAALLLTVITTGFKWLTRGYVYGSHGFLIVAWHSLLELGSGTGILGMAVSKLLQPDSCLVLTDGDDKAVDLLQSNLENPFNQIDSSFVGCTRLRWGNASDGRYLDTWCRRRWNHHWEKNERLVFDTVVAGDVLYKSRLPEVFFRTVVQFLADDGDLWLCHVPRADVTQEIVVAAANKAGLLVDQIALDNITASGCPVEDSSRARVYRCKLAPRTVGA